MLKYLFVLLIISLSFSPVQAQNIEASDSLLVLSPLQTDTVNAVHRLFYARHNGGVVTIRVGAGLTCVALGVGALAYGIGSTGGNVDSNRFAWGLLRINLPGLLLIGIGISKKARFSRGREKAIILAYQQGIPLSTKIRRELKPMYFPVKRDDILLP